MNIIIHILFISLSYVYACPCVRAQKSLIPSADVLGWDSLSDFQAKLLELTDEIKILRKTLNKVKIGTNNFVDVDELQMTGIFNSASLLQKNFDNLNLDLLKIKGDGGGMGGLLPNDLSLPNFKINDISNRVSHLFTNEGDDSYMKHKKQFVSTKTRKLSSADYDESHSDSDDGEEQTGYKRILQKLSNFVQPPERRLARTKQSKLTKEDYKSNHPHRKLSVMKNRNLSRKKDRNVVNDNPFPGQKNRNLSVPPMKNRQLSYGSPIPSGPYPPTKNRKLSTEDGGIFPPMKNRKLSSTEDGGIFPPMKNRKLSNKKNKVVTAKKSRKPKINRNLATKENKQFDKDKKIKKNRKISSK